MLAADERGMEARCARDDLTARSRSQALHGLAQTDQPHVSWDIMSDDVRGFLLRQLDLAWKLLAYHLDELGRRVV